MDPAALLKQKTVASWNELAQRYADKFMGLEIYHPSYRHFFDLLQAKATVLEIGAGPGVLADFAMQAYPQLDMIVTDAAPEMVALSQNRLPCYQHQELRAEDLGAFPSIVNGIAIAFCIPYLPFEDVELVISSATKKLHPQGALYISFMEDDYTASGLHRGSTGHEMMVYYYPESQITNWLTTAGFSIVYKESLPPGDLTSKRQCLIVARKTN